MRVQHSLEVLLVKVGRFFDLDFGLTGFVQKIEEIWKHLKEESTALVVQQF